MKYKAKVTAAWWIVMDVESGPDEPFGNYEDELSEVAIDRIIEDEKSFDEADWDVEIMEGYEEETK